MAGSASWDLLDDKEELELHKHRLLNVEEKPFKRITKRLSTVTSIANAHTASDPEAKSQNGQHDANESDGAEARVSSTVSELEQLKEDLALDFAAFDSSVARLQFLVDANARERERYVEDQKRILNESEEVRVRNTELREQLEAAKARLAERKKFDELAEQITSNKALKSRDDQRANLRKLEEECAELERESGTYTEVWRARRDQFQRLLEEGVLLRKQIRDEKEEVERREGMDEDGEDDGDGSREEQTPVHPGIASGNATPHPDSGATSTARDVSTPRPTELGSRTPAHESQMSEKTDGLKPRPDGVGSVSQPQSRAVSREPSLGPRDKTQEGDETDVDMVDASRVNGGDATPPHITVDTPGGDKMEVDGN